MAKQTPSFKQNVLIAICNGAQKYKDVFLDYEYEVFSKSFKTNKPYIISATKSNFLHLTGVNTNLTANQFFDKALNNTLTESDFDFNKKGQTEKIVKGSVRRKANVKTVYIDFFSEIIYTFLSFNKNKIINLHIRTGASTNDQRYNHEQNKKLFHHKPLLKRFAQKLCYPDKSN